jgi:hypothetical protein
LPNTVFTKVDYQLASLVDDIELGEIGLPDIQRPFVWESAKVRDLFDSMYRGYPVGHLLFWESGVEPGARQIGADAKQLVPKLLIVDGQQRLTSLFAVIKQRDIIGRDYAKHRLQIAFRPRDETFSVFNAAIARDPSFLHDIGEIWARPAYAVITEFLTRLREAGALATGEEERVAAALGRLEGLKSYPFTALVLGAQVSEERVAEVFVRINSKGKNLNQADFILTLMSVFWDDGRKELEDWSRRTRVPGSPAWNAFLAPEPDQLLRVSIALGFRRGRLEDAYSVLRGRDAHTGLVSPDARDEQFRRLAAAQSRVLDASVWKDFLQSLVRAGHRSGGTVSSNLAVVYSYALYLIGKYDYGVPPKQLRDAVARWFFMTSLTGRYSASPETQVAADLASLPTDLTAESFVSWVDVEVARQLTSDFWDITLPGALATSASRSPTLFAYLAALNILEAPVLFSKMKCSELASPALASGKAKVQRHHLFPRKYLENLGITDLKQVNQIANLTPLEWHDNLKISATDPREYWPSYLEAMRAGSDGIPRFSEREIEAMLHYHALPSDWPNVEYPAFLDERRRRMARVIKDAFEVLVHGEPDLRAESAWPPSKAAIDHVLSAGESSRVELKSSLRSDTLGKGIPPRVLEKVVARTVAGLLNGHGGLLIIGADDDGNVVGLEKDLATLQRQDLDGFQQALVQVLTSFLGPDVAAAVRIHVGRVEAERALALVDCPPFPRPVFLSDGDKKEFHVRAGNTTRLLDVAQAASYIGHHWGAGSVAGPQLSKELATSG